MPTNDYHFVDRWRVEADCRAVADIIEDALGLQRWWGSVYFAVKELEPGEGNHGTGKLIHVRAGGWLPYTLEINFRTVESGYPDCFTNGASWDVWRTSILNFFPEWPFYYLTL